MDEIEKLLKRGVDKIYPSYEELEKVLRSGKKLRLYQGFDPTGNQLHIGHMIGLRKLSQWQALGHEVIFLIGNFTAMVGDPSGKTTARKMLDENTVADNANSYIEQAGRILKFEGENPVKVLYNGDWLKNMSAIDFFRVAGLLSVNQVIERDLFQVRQKEGNDIYINEFLYPVMQAYDSIHMNVDLEIGGTDQMFNMMMGRKLMRNMLKKDKFVMTTPLLTDSEGRKIGKSEGNVIGLTDKPENLYGKIMSLSDDVIVKAMEYLTDIPLDEIKEIEAKLKDGENPIIYKKKLSYEIVKQLNSEKEAQLAQEAFQSVVQHKEIPKDIPIYEFPVGATASGTATASNLVDSASEWKRLVNQGAVSVNGIKIENPFVKNSELPDNGILKIGNRNYARIKKK